jgi:hypothetical protein
MGWEVNRPPATKPVALASLAVITKRNLLLFVAFTIIFCVFSPKLQCQAPKPQNPHPKTRNHPKINHLQAKNKSIQNCILVPLNLVK